MKLKELRKAKGISQEQAANALGISVRAYQNYEYGQREPNIEMIFKLADFYDVTTDYLLGRETGEPETLDKLVGEFNMSALEKKILDKYLNLPDSTREDLMNYLEQAVLEVKQESQIHISRTAARNGEPPRVEILTQEQVDEIKARPDADPDL